MAKNKLTEKIKGFFGGTNTPMPAKTSALVGTQINSRYVYSNGKILPITDQPLVKATEPYGTKIPNKVLDRASGWSQIANVSHNFTMDKIQAAFRAAERGDLTLLNG